MDGTVATFTAGPSVHCGKLHSHEIRTRVIVTQSGTVAGWAGGLAGSYVVVGVEELATFWLSGREYRDHHKTQDSRPTRQATVTVPNAPLWPHLFFTHPSQGPVNSTVRSPVFADANPKSIPSDLTASMAWGDNTVSPGTVILTSRWFLRGLRDWEVYGSLGTFAVTVTINSVGGASTAATGTLAVLNRAPKLGQRQRDRSTRAPTSQWI